MKAAALALLLPLAMCPEREAPGRAAAEIGVPPGSALFARRGDARAFDAAADGFAPIDCRGLEASRVALRAAARDAQGSRTGRVVETVGALVGGPAGALTGFIGAELTALVRSSGDVRLAAVEAVAVAKACDGPRAAARAPRATTGVRDVAVPSL